MRLSEEELNKTLQQLYRTLPKDFAGTLIIIALDSLNRRSKETPIPFPDIADGLEKAKEFLASKGTSIEEIIGEASNRKDCP